MHSKPADVAGVSLRSGGVKIRRVAQLALHGREHGDVELGLFLYRRHGRLLTPVRALPAGRVVVLRARARRLELDVAARARPRDHSAVAHARSLNPNRRCVSTGQIVGAGAVIAPRCVASPAGGDSGDGTGAT